VGGITVPAGGTFDPNNVNGTFTYTYAAIAVVPEAEGDAPGPITCTASVATGGSVGLTSFTFNQGTTIVRCTAPEDSGEVADTGTFTVTVVEPRLVFDNLPVNQTKTADGTDTATFTFATPVTAHEPPNPGDPSGEPASVICQTTVSPITTITSPITLPTHGPGQGLNGGAFMYICTATDTTDNSIHPFSAFFTLRVEDERTVLSNPGPQTATADATGTAFVSYPTVTPTETPSGESDSQGAGCTADNGATSTNFFASSGTFNEGVTTVSCNANDIPNAPNKDGTNPPGESAPSIHFTVTVIDEPTLLSNPGPQTAVADATDTALVTYTSVTTSETPSGESDSITPTCTADNGASSGDGFVSSGTFNLGVTTVSCNATDVVDGTNPPGIDAPPIQFTVTVTDQPVTLTMPPTQVANATSPAGATVTYMPGPVTAVEDGEAETIPITCTVNNGATSGDGFVSSGNFPIGDTTVTCTATDADGFSTTGSFVVHVKGAAEQISDLISLVNSFHLSPQGIQTSFDSQLQAVQTDLAANNTAQACSDLTSFISHVKAQSGKKLTVDQANQLLAAATRIQAVLGC
jgi:hypothetical protein